MAWSNLRLAQALARRLALNDPVFLASEREIMRELLRCGNDGGNGDVDAPDPAARRPAAFDPDTVRAAGPLRIAPSDGQRFATPSGRLEFYSHALADRDLAPMPDWRPDAEEQQQAACWPLRLLTAPGYFQPHTGYSGVASLRRREREPECILHPDEAASRGLTDGQHVRLFNDRGAVGFMLRISDEIQAAVALVPGQRRDEETWSGTVNMLCSDRYTDMGEGATYQSTWLEVESWDGAVRASMTTSPSTSL